MCTCWVRVGAARRAPIAPLAVPLSAVAAAAAAAAAAVQTCLGMKWHAPPAATPSAVATQPAAAAAPAAVAPPVCVWVTPSVCGGSESPCSVCGGPPVCVGAAAAPAAVARPVCVGGSQRALTGLGVSEGLGCKVASGVVV